MKRLLLLLFFAGLCTGCAEFEYEEDVHLGIDGSGEIDIIGARELFAALHGIGDPSDPDSVTVHSIRQFFHSPELEVVSVRRFERKGRTYFRVRARFEDLNELARHRGFAGRRMRLERGESLTLNADIEAVERSEGVRDLPRDGLIAFRFHFPSPVLHHNAPGGVERGNIISWERPVSEYLEGEPLHLEARFDRRTVFTTTLILLATAAALVILVIGGSLYLMTRVGRRKLAADADVLITPARSKP